MKINRKQLRRMILKEFKGSHPLAIMSWLPKDTGIFKTDPDYMISSKQKKPLGMF